MNTNLIYGYKRKSTGKIVYVGQTKNLKDRHKHHIKYDPFNKNTREYNYPLSRGIRKYGEGEYELIILEDNIQEDCLNDREKYWIKYYNTYYNGYNQTIGGKWPVKPIFNDEAINNVIEMLKDESYSLQDICNKTGISMTHIYNINTGARRKKDNIQYPIRKNNVKGTKGAKLSPSENKEIHEILVHSPKTFKEIGEMYRCSSATISRINKGKTKMYKIEGYDYPLRTD